MPPAVGDTERTSSGVDIGRRGVRGVVDNVDGRPVAYVYELDPALRTYALSGIHQDRLTLAVPFDVDIDLQAIDRL